MDDLQRSAALFTRAAAAFAPSHIKGLLQLTFSDAPELDCFVRFTDASLSLLAEADDEVDTRITLSLALLRLAYENPQLLDGRFPPWNDGATVEGNMSLLNLAMQLLKLPSAADQAFFDRVDRDPAYARVDHITLLDRPGAAEITRAICAGRPVVAKGLLDACPTRAWDWTTMCTEFGDAPLRYNPRTGEQETLSSFVRGMADSAKKTVYLKGCALPVSMKSLFDIPLFESFSTSPEHMWFGRELQDKCVTPLHRDTAHSVLMHFCGHKKFWIYPPSQADSVYPIKAFNSYQRCYVAYPRAYDTQCYPKFQQAKPLEIILAPGDLLMLPAGWFHCAWALDDVFSVSRFIGLNPFAKNLSAQAE
ncbi:MAG: cupin-like domain-containing protein [Herminiimonas sp.]|nr:cupin-like domain-containing protein [Herminiimonas sp.]